MKRNNQLAFKLSLIKKKAGNVCLTAAICLSIVSCKQEESAVEPDQKGQSQVSQVAEQAHFSRSEFAVESLLSRSKAARKQQIVNALYRLGGSLREVASDKNLQTRMAKEAKNSIYKQVNLKDLLQADPQIQSRLDQSIKNKAKSARLNGDDQINDIADVFEAMDLDTIQYDPVVYIPNAETADFNLPAIIAIGEEVTEEQGAKGEEDIIAGWDQEGNDILISESQAMSSKHPVMIMTYGYIKENTFPTGVVRPASEVSDTIVNTAGNARVMANSPTITDYEIWEHYDDSNQNECRYFYRAYFGSGYSTEDLGSANFLANIHQDDLMKRYYPNLNIATAWANMAGMWLVTFEYDWYAAMKSVTVDQGPYYQNLNVRMKFANEYYTRMFCYKNNIWSRYEKAYIRTVWPL